MILDLLFLVQLDKWRVYYIIHDILLFFSLECQFSYKPHDMTQHKYISFPSTKYVDMLSKETQAQYIAYEISLQNVFIVMYDIIYIHST